MPLMFDPNKQEQVEVSEAWIARWPDDYLPIDPVEPDPAPDDTETKPAARRPSTRKKRSR